METPIYFEVSASTGTRPEAILSDQQSRAVQLQRKLDRWHSDVYMMTRAWKRDRWEAHTKRAAQRMAVSRGMTLDQAKKVYP